ncbi:hypothetical protein EG329_006177 [Mollisiaceae sp. DMI_Dod_QoI]|nr:hypothetical protein EG329_006177 [Helotiales sp. DMI_Dod_QoI]
MDSKRPSQMRRIAFQHRFRHSFFTNNARVAKMKTEDGKTEMELRDQDESILDPESSSDLQPSSDVESFSDESGESSRQTFENVQVVGSRVNWDLAARWLADCLSGHKECAGSGSGTLPASFRVIDIRRRCLVQAGPDCHFVALSYVWGKAPDPTKLFATKSNIETLRREGGLPASDVPATVEDAMEVCRRLNENYIWVDRFCIIQDDSDDKIEQIVAMATIYSQAKFVIITTDGDSDSGISGVSHERSQTQIHDQISGVKFINSVAGWREITGGSSIWSTRGWTYQEAILPRRKLFLTDSQAFFECGENVLDEDGLSQQALYSSNALHPESWEPLIDSFYSHLVSYRSRSLTVASDIYNAIDGVATALYGEPHSLWFGLPRQDFDKGLLWCMDWNMGSEKTDSPTNGTSPSWSWSSTDRDVVLLDDCNRRSVRFCDTLVKWAFCCKYGSTRRLESIETISGKPLNNFQVGQDICGCPTTIDERVLDRLLYLAIAWTQGCINKPCPFDHLRKTTFSALKSLIASRWTCHHRFWLDALRDPVDNPEGATSQNWTSEELNHVKDPLIDNPSIIVALAQSAFFRLQGSVQRETHLGDLCIIDEEGQPAGLLIARDLGLDLELAPEIKTGSKFEFIALSMSTVTEIVLPNGDLSVTNEQAIQSGLVSLDAGSVPNSTSNDDESVYMSEQDSNAKSTNSEKELEANDSSDTEQRSSEEFTFQDSEGTYLFPLPVVNVMLIRRREGLARRVSVGWVYLTAWTRACPEFKSIHLE